LDAYCKKWHEEFALHQNEIVDACAQLPDLHKYAANQEIGTKKYIEEISRQPWFHERVLDTYLWSLGSVSWNDK
ncbi:MAG: hypothetical protein Q8O24_06315, partial [Gallionellaceae bacterium]|nr:hypothetical protein [Gallionellaceae bacterium]